MSGFSIVNCNSIAPVCTIQQAVLPVCRRTNNYSVAILSTSVSSFLLQGLDREQEARFDGYAIFKIMDYAATNSGLP